MKIPLPYINIFDSENLNDYEKIQSLAKLKYKPWTSSEWKKERAAIIASSCSHCGSIDKLVLQHTKPKPRVWDIFNSIRRDCFADYYNKKIDALPSLSRYETKLACPECGGTNLIYRKRTEDYRCKTQQNKLVCDAIVDPVEFSLFIPEPSSVKRRRVWHLFAQDETEQALLHRLTLDRYHYLLSEYFSFIHVTTLCKRHAFLQDAVSGYVQSFNYVSVHKAYINDFIRPRMAALSSELS